VNLGDYEPAKLQELNPETFAKAYGEQRLIMKVHAAEIHFWAVEMAKMRAFEVEAASRRGDPCE
jgi:hypothetical protein